MDKLCLFLKPNHHCLPVFSVLCQEFGTLSYFFQLTRIPAAYIFPTTNYNTCLLSSVCDLQGLFSMSAGIILWRRLVKAYPTAQSGFACLLIQCKGVILSTPKLSAAFRRDSSIRLT